MDHGFLDRRTFLSKSALGLAPLSLAGLLPRTAPVCFGSERDSRSPHFVLHLCVSGGMDNSYLFDARPLKLTDLGLVSNFGYKNAATNKPLLSDPTPRVYEGKNGGKLLRSPLTDQLATFLPQLSIINGVLMSPDGNGHGQNMYYMFTNSTSNGDSFMPMLSLKSGLPLQSVHFGGFEGDGNRPPNNFGLSVRLGYDQGSKLAKDLVESKRFALDSAPFAFIKQRLNQRSIAGGPGAFSHGLQKMDASQSRLASLSQAIGGAGVSIPAEARVQNADASVRSALSTTLSYFSGGVTDAVTIVLDKDPVIDTHSGNDAQDQVNLYGPIVSTIEEVIRSLQLTQFENGKSFWDVTTLMISSEFSRTYRQTGISIGATGTDHNPFRNSIVLGGKGINPGLVLGASDLTDADDQSNWKNVSLAHLDRDPRLLSSMAKPFDFTTFRVRDDLPQKFAVLDYLNVQSVVNTVMSMKNVPEDKLFRVAGVRAPILSILKSI